MSLMDNRVFAGLRLLRDLVEQRKSNVMVFESDDPDFFIAHLDFPKVQDVPDVPGAQSIVDGWPEFSVWLTNCPCVSIAKVRGRTRGIDNEFIYSEKQRSRTDEKLSSMIVRSLQHLAESHE